MKIQQATKEYEAWLAGQTTIVPEGLKLKHKAMRTAAFPFLRATFYRWAQTWPHLCPSLAEAPAVLAVGDLHVENFGTWRDREGRLVWGVNDFDEAYRLSYANDLVRLAVSAIFAAAEGQIHLSRSALCEAILDGYAAGLKAGGRPFVLAEHHEWLRRLGLSVLRDPSLFWQKMRDLPLVEGDIPQSAREAMEHLLPEPDISYRVLHRTAGLGSLGRQRFVALAEWRGGYVAREAKALLPSAAFWAANGHPDSEILYQAALSRAVRSADPFVELRGEWIVRRLAPDCARVELASLPEERDECRLLHDMGWETANVHVGSYEAAPAILEDLKRRGARWLENAAEIMHASVERDWHDYQKE